jgi:YD repeat-containing protein
MGNEIETFYYNANDSLCQIDGDVYAGVSHIYDKNHHPLETRYYGTDGKLIEIEEGFAIARYAYNALGNCTEVSTYDSQDRPCNRAKGYARKTAKYDYHGRITEESYFDVKGKPCNDTTGVSTKKYSYDRLGNVKVSLEKLAL